LQQMATPALHVCTAVRNIICEAIYNASTRDVKHTVQSMLQLL